MSETSCKEMSLTMFLIQNLRSVYLRNVYLLRAIVTFVGIFAYITTFFLATKFATFCIKKF